MGHFVVRLSDHPAILKWLVGFAAWSLFWVLCSDYVLHYFVASAPPVIWSLESIEGLVYVAITGIITLFLVRDLQR